ncbi:MAG: bifunctional DNA primase/polymerase [Mycobacterium sp.]
MTTEVAPGLVQGTGGSSNSNSEATDRDLHNNGQRAQHDSDYIYRRGAGLYREAGWRGVLPLPPGKKVPPPTGFTGYDGAWPTDQQIEWWIAHEPTDANLGLRVSYGFVGIDVDAYGNKTGVLTLAEAERRWGPLPPTYRSTARLDDLVSGIRVFKVPLGVFFRGDLRFVLDDGRDVGHIEFIQPHHRLVVAWPSWHSRVEAYYRWFDDRLGKLMPEGSVPPVDNIAELPQAWIEGLSRDAVREEFFDNSAPHRTTKVRDNIDEKLYQKLIALEDKRDPEPVVKARLDRAVTNLDSDSGSRYDTTRDHVAALMRYQAIGRAGVPKTLYELYRLYVSKVADTRPREVAEPEFERLTQGAAALIAGTMPSEPYQPAERTSPEDAESVEHPMNSAEDRPSWSSVDLSDLLDGVREPLLPTLFERSDGHCLLYPGMVHSFHGEPESGKSLIVQAECVRLLNHNRDVLYLDFDSDDRSVVDRLLEFGADPQSIAAHFHYLQPEVKPESSDERRLWAEILSAKYALAVIDGVTDALGVFGCSTNDNDDVARWIRTVPKVIAARTGAAVVLIDHVVKDSSKQNRFAIGGQAKMAGLTGAAYTVDVVAPLGRGLRGELVLRIAKDRPGEVRRHCGSFKNRDRTQEAARIVVDSTTEPPTVAIGAPNYRCEEGAGAPQPFRPTALMQRVSEGIEQQPGKLTKTKAAIAAGGRRQLALLAFDVLEREGYLTSERGRSGHPFYSVVKPYREKDDPLSDRYVDSGNSFPSQ